MVIWWDPADSNWYGSKPSIFPLTYAIVKVNGNDSWSWFIQVLVDALGRDFEEKRWCIMSYRQKVR